MAISTYDALLGDLRTQIPAIEVDELANSLATQTVIDCREADEHAAGAIPGAVWLPRGFLEARVERAVPDRDAAVVVYCAGGVRSLFAARTLAELGYTRVRSLTGGFAAWKAAGRPWAASAGLRADQQLRYARHLAIPEVGEAGQQKLLAAKIACIGAGGLGSPVALYLAAAGVGTLGIVDDDVVDASNLQRQILHGSDRIGMAKVDSAEQALRRLTPDVRVVKHPTRLVAANAAQILAGYDVIVDGADNFPTRYLVNDVALRLGKPVVHASVFRFDGQLTVFPAGGSPCYRCLFPVPPRAEDAPSCADAGVLGVLPGVLGVLQATEALKLVLGIGSSLAGRLVLYDALAARFRELRIAGDPRCPSCGDGVDRAHVPLVDYDELCRR
jgi:molybdopterin/thiamine biosynthesis adenylyltransferase/rhodanese-related sulfurtransferase